MEHTIINLQTAIITIESLLEQAETIAVEWLTAHLNKMLIDNKGEVDEFFNGMGVTAFYKDKEPLLHSDIEQLEGYKELEQFFDKFIDRLCLKGILIEGKI